MAKIASTAISGLSAADPIGVADRDGEGPRDSRDGLPAHVGQDLDLDILNDGGVERHRHNGILQHLSGDNLSGGGTVEDGGAGKRGAHLACGFFGR
jgi:hypothetical protein